MYKNFTLKTFLVAAFAMLTLQGCQDVNASDRLKAWMSGMLTPRAAAPVVEADGFI